MGAASRACCWVQAMEPVCGAGLRISRSFILFWAVVLLLDAGQSRAYAVSPPVLVRVAITPDLAPSRPASLPDRPGRPAGHDLYNAQPGPEQARLLLSLAFATLAAVNLG